MQTIKTRFAPSPTGWIHLGNARTALFNRLFGGEFLLRIEDTDQTRSQPEFVAALLEDLAWLNLNWQEGPASPEPDSYFQSLRSDLYERYYAQLEKNNRVYPCFCTPDELALSRKAQRAAGLPPKYSGKCAHLSADEIQRRLDEGLQPTLRFRVPQGIGITFEDLVRGQQHFDSDTIGDFIIRRADGTPAFFFCNAVDDALMKVTHVLRGEDHLTNTPRQLLILEALGLPAPRYGHISLILGEDGAPLSKRNGSRSIRELREQGYLPLAVINFLARLGHAYGEETLLSLEQLAEKFQLQKLGRAPARFDAKQLDYWQNQAVRAADDETLWRWLTEPTRKLIPDTHRTLFLTLVRSNCLFPEEAQPWAEIIFGDDFPITENAHQILKQTQSESDFFSAAIEAARRNPEDYPAFLEALKKATGTRGKRLFQPLRAALTGRLDGPEIQRIYTLLGSERIIDRFIRLAES
ncbi:MAG: glutamate--tRNA ligase [Methylothermaceae bacterium]|nr:glutamate--tRNA ligase [Methylothermaceae bacterium]